MVRRAFSSASLQIRKRITWSRVWYLVVLADWIERSGIEG
jgi:hypothetical protein